MKIAVVGASGNPSDVRCPVGEFVGVSKTMSVQVLPDVGARRWFGPACRRPAGRLTVR